MKPLKLSCNDCGRKIKDHPESKIRHVLKYHPHIPLIRIATSLFTPMNYFEEIGRQVGERFKRVLQ